MSIANFLEEICNLDIDLTECQLKDLKQKLKDSYEALEVIFKGHTVAERHLRPFKSKVSKEILQKKRHEMPDIFYNFIDENVSIYIWYAPAKRYFICCRNWRIEPDELKAIFYEYNLFADDEYYAKIEEDNGHTIKILGIKDLNKAIWAWRKIIRYYVQQSIHKDNIERYKNKIY